MPSLKLHNTLSGEKEEFIPVDPDHVRIYACGPTVYSYAHIGNARMAVVFDQLARLLKRLYPKVTYASNITDVDDKIMAAAAQSGEDIGEITRKYTRIYNEDMAALGAGAPDIQPRATEHIDDMVAQIGSLIRHGHAYEADGHVLFSVPSYPAYGRLSRRSRDEQVAGARVEIAPYKKDPADFVLWKPSSDDQPGWDSPWGRGRPGWHIECSAMSERHLGLPFDIHGGGADLKFPHHENEIAQSCCAHGHEDDVTAFAKYWIHNGFLTVEGDKMAKSVGNIRLVHELLDQYSGEVLRMTLLSAHYRQPLDWSVQGIDNARAFLDRLYHILEDLEDVPAADNGAPPEEILEALCDDLNTPKAFAVLNALAKEAAAARDPNAKTHLLAAGKLLGVLEHDPAQWFGYGAAEDVDAAQVEALLTERQEARAAKDFARADAIRDELDAMGIVIEDTPAGPKWRQAG
ncbi:MAG: cysteine--tRNA ligase [Rhodospirillales bacterium]|nr:cysteine--tRNA ligase [Rhodospirillales bacterium]MCB9996103.1 cysteine--tRNA ligase [Rhodospirillales bacterium]